MLEQFSREELLIGKESLEKLKNSKVIVYGVGGVGSYVVEGLARAGIGHIIIVDPDKVDITNINRQLCALDSTIGKLKVEVVKNRILDINPNALVEAYTPKDIEDGEENLIEESVDYVIDAIDTITNKLKIIEKCEKENIKIISATGAANRLDPSKFEITDVNKTSICPVCKILRKELKKRNIKKLKVIYSKEEPIKFERQDNKKVLGSISFVPSVAGLMIASEVVKDLIN